MPKPNPTPTDSSAKTDPITGQGQPPPNPYGSTSFIPPGRNGWAQNHEIDPEWTPGTGKPRLAFNPEDIISDDNFTVGGGRAIDAILAGPIANNEPGEPGHSSIAANLRLQAVHGTSTANVTA
jgi:hypothetical protein